MFFVVFRDPVVNPKPLPKFDFAVYAVYAALPTATLKYSPKRTPSNIAKIRS
jgi:hypothetical protein